VRGDGSLAGQTIGSSDPASALSVSTHPSHCCPREGGDPSMFAAWCVASRVAGALQNPLAFRLIAGSLDLRLRGDAGGGGEVLRAWLSAKAFRREDTHADLLVVTLCGGAADEPGTRGCTRTGAVVGSKRRDPSTVPAQAGTEACSGLDAWLAVLLALSKTHPPFRLVAARLDLRLRGDNGSEGGA
jgi:hypothetical protein